MNCRCWFYTLLVFVALWFLSPGKVFSQTLTPSVVAAFSVPDTVCTGRNVPITNLSQGATTYYWKFCTGDPLTDMHGIDVGNPSGFLNVPLGISLAQDNGSFFAYVTNSGNATISKYSWGNSFFKPVFAENMGNFGLLTNQIFGIQVKKDAGNWYGFVTNGNQLIRINLGTSLAVDALSAQVVATSPSMNLARGLVIEQDGADWVGFCTNYPGKTITRFHWTSGLGGANPTVTDLGFSNILLDPMQPALIRDNQGWHMLVANTNSLAQFDFGNSLLNTPAVTDFKDLAWMTDSRGISLFMECNNPYSFITNHNVVANLILQVNFIGGIMGPKKITPLGSVANLYLPTGLSESLHNGDTIYTIAVNENSLTTLYFPPCTNSPLPPSTQFEPTPVQFPSIGKYTIKLTVDIGLPTEQTVCKVIYADAPPVINLGHDTTICQGTTLELDAGAGFSVYQWNTGETTRKILVDTAGNYFVVATKANTCFDQDSIRVGISKPGASETDTAICQGERYYAGGQWQTKTGTYVDSLVTKYGCDSLHTTNLTVKPPVFVNIGNDTCIFRGDTYKMVARGTSGAGYMWQDGSQDSTFTVTEPGVYWVVATKSQCSSSDTVVVNPCPALIFFPTAFTPNGDGLNDTFQPRGTDIGQFHMTIFDRWGHQVFETNDPNRGWNGMIGGEFAETGVYTYVASYSQNETPGQTNTVSGSLTLLK